MLVPRTAPSSFASRLSTRVLYAALMVLSIAGALVVGSRYLAELENGKRLLQEDLRARSVAVAQSLHVAHAAAAALAKEAGRLEEEEPGRAGGLEDLLRIVYGARGTSDIAGFLYAGAGRAVCMPAEAAACPSWLENISRQQAMGPLREARWMPPAAAEDGDLSVAVLLPAGGEGGADRGGADRPLVAAELRLASLDKYTIPVHTVESVVSLLDEEGRVIVDGAGIQPPGTPWQVPRPGHPPMPVDRDRLNGWAGRLAPVGAVYVAVDRVAGPGWFILARLPAATLAGEAAGATADLALAVLAGLILLWTAMAVLERKVLRPAQAAGERLAETLSNLEATFAAVSDGIALLDGGRRLVACNGNFGALLGLDGDALRIGEKIPVILGEGGDRSRQFLNSRGCWVEARLGDWAFGGRSGVVVVLTDVTERREATERLTAAKRQAEETLADLRQAQAQLVETEKLAALGGLVAGVAHEINTPIGVALSAATSLSDMTRRFIGELRQGAVRRSAFDRYLARLEEAVGLVERNLSRAGELICHFKQVAVDRTSCQRRRFDLSEVVGDVVGTLYPTLKRTAFTVRTEIPPGILLDGFPGPLGQIITNLVTNALTHAFEGRTAGAITIAAQIPEGGGGIVVLSCRDDGIGMSAAVMKRMFEPFFTTRRGRGGSGLGMHIVYSLITGLMGGEIMVQSSPGEGTDVTMMLPLRAPDGAPEAITLAAATLPEAPTAEEVCHA